MKKLLLLSLVSLSFPLFAATPAGGDSDFEPSDQATHFPAMIWVEDGDVDETIADLESQGVRVLYHRDDILLTYIPVGWSYEGKEGEDDDANSGEEGGEDTAPDRKRKKSKDASIKIEYSRPRENTPLMNLARYFNNANYIAEGYELPSPYDGKGVVVGVCDIGMDTRHPNFLSLDGEECRIRRVVHYQEEQGLRNVYSTPQEIYDWQTDYTDDWHATHVTGIAAGASPLPTALNQSYSSLAPQADIVFTASQLSDVGLLAGVEDIIAYAKDVKKPAVINLSMGNTVGPHDGTSLFTRYLDLCAEDAIICLSAGNDGGGGEPRAMKYTFTEAKKELKLRPSDWDGFEVGGTTEIWSADDTPFEVSFVAYHNLTPYNHIPFKGQISEDGTLKRWRISVDPEDPDYDEVLATYFTEGYVEITCGVSSLNNRYYAEVTFELDSEEYSPEGGWSLYWTALSISGAPGTEIDIYCSSGIFLRRANGYTVPDNNMNISDLATGFKTISVGMMNNTDYEDNHEAGSGYKEGDVNIHSSYGTLNDGRKLPVTVAPGAYVTSSISSPFLEKYPEELIYTDDSSEYEGNTIYWIGTIGTSMSSPYVAGAIATWLQAYPLLTSEEALEIVQQTNQKSGYPKTSDPRHGQGWFQPYNGLQKVVELAALKVGTVDSPQLTLKLHGGVLHIGNPSGTKIVVEVYSPSGVKTMATVCSDTLGTVDLRALPSGIYLVKVGNETLKVIL